MSKGKLTARYDLPIPDLEVRDPELFTQQIAGRPSWTASVEPSPTGLTLQIEIETDDPYAAAGAADAYAQRVADHFTFWLCDRDVSHPVTARRSGPVAFQSADPNVFSALPGALVLTGYAATLQLTRRVPGDEIKQALAAFSLSEAAPPPAFANDLVIARQMYLAGQRVESVIARFLITYAAMAVFARFKCGVGGQLHIDAVLQSEDPTLPMHPSPRKGAGNETQFTSARNAFIHAEDRARDPAAAMAAIEAVAPKFQIFVGRILRKG